MVKGMHVDNVEKEKLYIIKILRIDSKYALKYIFFRWSGREDLNLRPLDPEPSALPNCATPRKPQLNYIITIYSRLLIYLD